MYGDFRENLLEILAVVIISIPIFSVCGYLLTLHVTMLEMQMTALTGGTVEELTQII